METKSPPSTPSVPTSPAPSDQPNQQQSPTTTEPSEPQTPPQQTSTITAEGLPLKGSVNILEGFFGAPGTGKSTAALRRTIEYARRLPAYAFAHDPNENLPTHFHWGPATGLRRHESSDAVMAQLRHDPTGVHCLPSIDAGDALSLATRVAKMGLDRNQGARGVPSIVLVDEMVALNDATPYRLGDQLRQLIARRRHWHTGMLWTCQSPRMAHFQLTTMCTRLFLFRLTHRKDLNAVEDVGVPSEIVEELPRLPDYRFFCWNLSTGRIESGAEDGDV